MFKFVLKLALENHLFLSLLTAMHLLKFARVPLTGCLRDNLREHPCGLVKLGCDQAENSEEVNAVILFIRLAD